MVKRSYSSGSTTTREDRGVSWPPVNQGMEIRRCCWSLTVRPRTRQTATTMSRTPATQTGTTISTDASSAFFFFLKRDLSQAEHLQASLALTPLVDSALQFFFA